MSGDQERAFRWLKDVVRQFVEATEDSATRTPRISRYLFSSAKDALQFAHESEELTTNANHETK